MSEDKIEGTEDKQVLEDWFEGVAMKVSLIYIGAKAILDWAAANATEITPSEISRRSEICLAKMLSLQLYAFLKSKNNTSDANHLKTLSSLREVWKVGKICPRN